MIETTERECGYCHEVHEQGRCDKCNGFLRCQADRLDRNVDEETHSGISFYTHIYVHTCRRCGHENETWRSTYGPLGEGEEP